MPDHLPIACRLNATDFAFRSRSIAELGADALVGAERSGSRAELRFAARDGLLERVDRFVAGEQECCAFLTMTVAPSADAIVLTIDAPPDGELALAEMVAALAGPDRLEA